MVTRALSNIELSGKIGSTDSWMQRKHSGYWYTCQRRLFAYTNANAVPLGMVPVVQTEACMVV